MTALSQPDCCTICGYYLIMAEQYSGSRCVDPGHWQAAGLLGPKDFYGLALIAALARLEQTRRNGSQGIANASSTFV